MRDATAKEVESRLRMDEEGWCVSRGHIAPCSAPRNDGSLRGVTVREYEACGLTPKGALRCWLDRAGRGVEREFSGRFVSASIAERIAKRADGTFSWIGESSTLPVSNLTEVHSDGFSSVCGLDVDGVVWCWSANGGDAERYQGALPFVALEHTGLVTCAIDEASGLWCWGSAESGKLGDGSQRCASTPVDLTVAMHTAFAN